LQSAAVTSLARIADDSVPALLTAAWASSTPALRSQILDVFLSRPAWQRALLQAVEKKQVPAAHIDSARRQRLLAGKDRELAARLLAGATNPDRQKVLKAYGDVPSMKGDPAHGKKVFAKHCATCHRLHDVGHAVGPDLAAVTNRTPQFLLIAILDPNKEVDPRYVEYVATTRDGRVFTGILAAESATSITLRAQEGREQVFLRSDVDELVSTNKSMMPEGLEKELSKQDLADLISYLSAAKSAQRFTGGRPAMVRAAPLAVTPRAAHETSAKQ
jgi:putative heme-binding domain-containing protein